MVWFSSVLASRFVIRILLTFILVLCFRQGFSQEFLPKFRSFGISEGLSTSSVTSICEDNEGKIWIGTYDGLNCSYGTFFKVFYQEINGLSQSAISDMICDKKGNLWIVTYGGGLSLMDPLSQKFLPLPKGLKNDWLQGNCVAEDPTGRIWMGYYEGVRIYDPKTETLVQIENPPGSSGRFPVTRIAFDQAGNAWLSTPFQGLYVVNGSGKWNPIAHFPISTLQAEPKGIGFFHKLYKEESGILACTQSGIIHFQLKSGKIDFEVQPFTDFSGEPKAYLKDIHGNRWVGSSQEKIYLTAKNGNRINTHLPYRGRYETGSVTDIHQDKMGGVWIGGDEGLSYTHPEMSKFVSYSNSKDFKADGFKIVWGIYTEDDHQFILGSRLGLYSFNAQTFQMEEIPIKGKMEKGAVYTFLKSNSGDVWAGTHQGLVSISGLGKKPTATRIFPEIQGIVASLCKRPNGEMYVGSYDERGLFCIPSKPSKAKLENFKNEEGNAKSLCNNSINTIINGKNGELIIGTDNGVSHFNPESKEFSNEIWSSRPVDFPISQLIYGLVDVENELWMGTYGSGILIYNKSTKSWSRLTRSSGLLNESIYAMAQNGDFIWASSNFGLVKIDIQTKKMETFTEGDGLQSNEFNHFAVFKNDLSGKTYFGGVNGFDEISQCIKHRNSQAPKVVLSSARIFGDKSTTTLSLGSLPWELNSFQRDLELEFSALNFLIPELNEFAYSFESQPEKRIFLGKKNKITLINLDKGRNTILVFGSNNEGVWSKEPLRISFGIRPYFYETLWFQLVVLVAILVLFGWIVHLYLKSKLKKRELEWERIQAVREERTRISAEMHDDLGSGLTSIKMLSDLLILKAKNSPEPELNKIANRSEEMVDSLNTIVWALNDRNDQVNAVVAYLRQYAREQFEDSSIEISIQLTVDPKIENKNIPGETRRDIFLILKEAINNLLKHAAATQAWVKIEANTDFFEMIIHDNGTAGKSDASISGNGLINMKNRAKECNGTLEVLNEDGFQVRFYTTIYYERVIQNRI